MWGEAKRLLLGSKLGEGMSRKVYQCRLDPSLVLKIESKGGQFQNVAEWDVWSWVCGTKHERWFAPCVAISPCGSILVMKRAEPIRASERPTRLPKFLCDLKRENFGMIDGKIVCLDYGTIASVIRTMPLKTSKANWIA